MRDQNTVKREFTEMSTPELNGSPERTIAMFNTVLAARLHAKENHPGLPANLIHFGVRLLGGQLTRSTGLPHLLALA